MKDNLSIHIKQYFLLTFDEENRDFKFNLSNWDEKSRLFKGGFMSEGTGGFLLLPKNIPSLYPEQKILINCLLLWAEN